MNSQLASGSWKSKKGEHRLPLGAIVLISVIGLLAPQHASGQLTKQQIERRPRPPSSAVNALMNQGNVSGYVFWDTASAKHNMLNCGGLSVSLGVPISSGGSTPTFEQFKTVATDSTLVSNSPTGSLASCTYSFSSVPTGQDLRVQVAVTPGAFSPSVTPGKPPTAQDPSGPMRIPSGMCIKIPPPLSASVLNSGWWTCGNHAYNVNFMLQVPPHVMSGSTMMQRAQSSYVASRESARNLHMPTIGTITGLVWWDTTKIQLNSSACINVSVMAQVAQKSPNSPFPSILQVGTSSSPTPMPPNGSNAVCRYEITQLSLGTPLSLRVVLPAIFNTTGNVASASQVPWFGQVTLPTGPCGAPPALQVNASMNYCGDGAYNANFSISLAPPVPAPN